MRRTSAKSALQSEFERVVQEQERLDAAERASGNLQEQETRGLGCLALFFVLGLGLGSALTWWVLA